MESATKGLKVIGIAASPRGQSNSTALLKAALKGVESQGITTRILELIKYNVLQCMGCNICVHDGKCRLVDDMYDLYPEVSAADGILFATPIYFYSLPGFAKIFIDRFQLYWVKKYVLKEKMSCRGLGAMIAVAGTKGEKVFLPSELTLKYFFDSLCLEQYQSLTFREVGPMGEFEVTAPMKQQAEKYGKQYAKILKQHLLNK
ncbi:flavodoxin family protein [bacterium]|nr:flavodoxin family protein [bacterium]